jgi:hypothetical protein
LQIGIQGFKGEKVVSKDTKVNFVMFKSGISGLVVEVFDSNNDELPIASISDSDIEGNSKQLQLGVGEYYYVYSLNGQRITKVNSRNDITKLYLESRDFNIIPQKATYTFTHKGKTYDTLSKVTGKVTVNLSTAEEGAKIFYKVNSGDWVEGNIVECNDGGNYTIKVKTVINGYESVEQNIWVRTSLNLYIPDALMLVLVVLLTLVLFLVVLPIVSKKYFKKD